MTPYEQIVAYFGMLFRPGEVFEVRVKRQDEKGAKQIWKKFEHVDQFAKTHVPIHENHGRHVWVGVCPRERVGSSVATHGRVLWCDLDDISYEASLRALERSNLPHPSMIVNSGTGIHFYWKLDRSHPADELRPYSKGVHASLPSDVTHDPTRVMRVPGTKHMKDPENPRDCTIIEHDEEKVYSLDQFPKEKKPKFTSGADDTNAVSEPLSQEDFELFVSNWLDGQKHHMAVAVAGYLRKNLYQDKQTCLENIQKIHEAAGYSWPDSNLLKVVDDTYSKPFATVAGTSRLMEFGVVPKHKDKFTFSFKRPPKPKVRIIDFNKEIKPQEFWVDGLIGPGLLTIWAAEPKTGKSYAVMQLGYALSQGHDIWGMDVTKPVNVLYFQGELSEGMVAQRALDMFGAESLKRPDRFAITDKPEKFVNLVTSPEVLNDIAEDYDVIIVDPIAAFTANDENSKVMVQETLSVFDTLRAKGKAVVLVHHTKKLQADRKGNPVPPTFNDVRGSSAWFGTADAIALQYRTSGEGDVTKVKFAFRAAPERDPLTLFRRPTGGFTADSKEYLAQTGGVMRIPTSQLN